MLNNNTPRLAHLQNTLLSTIEELIVVLDTEHQLMQDNHKANDEILKAVVNEKQILADEYAAYCKQFHHLPQTMQEELGAFAREHKDLFEEFSFKLKRNLETIEARFKQTQMRIDSVLNAVKGKDNTPHAYGASGEISSNVVPFRSEFSQSVAS